MLRHNPKPATSALFRVAEVSPESGDSALRKHRAASLQALLPYLSVSLQQIILILAIPSLGSNHLCPIS